MTSKETTYKRNGIIGLMIIIAFLFAMDAFSQNKTEEDGYIYEEFKERTIEDIFYLPISGLVKEGKHKLEAATVNLYNENALVKTFVTKKNGKFEMELDLGSHYTIEVMKEGFITKRIGINTVSEVDYKRMDYLPFGVDIHISKELVYEGTDTDVLDYPFALVSYDHNDRMFLHDEKYTDGMLDADKRLKHSAMLQNLQEEKSREF